MEYLPFDFFYVMSYFPIVMLKKFSGASTKEKKIEY